ncbi:MAG: hypothetical protein OD811_04030, partial [Alphaproteobacteria bacterium]
RIHGTTLRVAVGQEEGAQSAVSAESPGWASVIEFSDERLSDDGSEAETIDAGLGFWIESDVGAESVI